MPYPTIITKHGAPIVYHPNYNIPFANWLHSFDTQKYSKIVSRVSFFQEEKHFQSPTEELADELMVHSHSPEYLASLQSSSGLAEALHIPLLSWVPYWILKKTLVRSVKLQYAGSVIAGHYAMEHGYAINIGGGYHHASRSEGGGFSMLADITAIVHSLFESGKAKKIMIIDFDAHQGDGYETDLRKEVRDGQVHIVDAYTPELFTDWNNTREVIGTKFYYSCEDDGTNFLKNVRRKLPPIMESFQPDLVIYNAGTDPLEGDKYGGLKFTEKAIIERDEFVWKTCGIPYDNLNEDNQEKSCDGGNNRGRTRRSSTSRAISARRTSVTGAKAHKHKYKHIPIVMLLSGGYTAKSIDAISSSFTNIFTKFGLLKK